MTTRTLITLLITTVSLFSLSACTNTVQYGKVTPSENNTFYASNDELISAAEKMTRNLLAYPTIKAMLKRKHPKIAIISLINQTSGAIDTNLMEDALVESLEQSGKFSITNRDNAKTAQANITNNQLFPFIDASIAKKIGSKTKADYLLYGSLDNIIRTKPNKKEVYYKFKLHMLNTKSGKVVWQNELEILKSKKKAVFGI